MKCHAVSPLCPLGLEFRHHFSESFVGRLICTKINRAPEKRLRLSGVGADGVVVKPKALKRLRVFGVDLRCPGIAGFCILEAVTPLIVGYLNQITSEAPKLNGIWMYFQGALDKLKIFGADAVILGDGLADLGGNLFWFLFHTVHTFE